jgi:hypothetical protein
MIYFNKGIVAAYVTAILVLIGGAIGFRGVISGLEYHMMKKPVKLRLALSGIDTRLGNWQQVGKDSTYGAAEIESLGTDVVLTRVYQREGPKGKERLELHVAYYTGKIDSVPHVPERCWSTAGLQQTISPEHIALEIDGTWDRSEDLVHSSTQEPYPFIERVHPVTGKNEMVYMPVGDMLIRTTEFQVEKKPTQRIVGGYFFIANGRLTPSAFGVRSLAFNRTDEYAYYCKVQLNYMGIANEDREVMANFIPIASDFLIEFLPELMSRLPDWPSVDQLASSSENNI